MISKFRLFLPKNISTPSLSNRHRNYIATSGKYVNEQMDRIKSIIDEEKQIDWGEMKKQVLDIHGSVNSRNIDGVLFKIMINNKKYDAAMSYANYLKESKFELTLGSINGLLALYFEMSKQAKLTENQEKFILETYDNLYKKYEILDYATCERLLHALCAINDYEKCYKVLNDLLLSSVPTHSAYSTFISMLFNNNKIKEAKEMIQQSTRNKRSLEYEAYDAWIKYIFRKHRQKKTRTQHLEEICHHISDNNLTLPGKSANLVKDTFSNVGWNTYYTEISRRSGQCSTCKVNLECLRLSDEEFGLLQANVKEKLIVGSDLFLKTQPDELQRFLTFLEKTRPYDIVLDGLNIALSCGHNQHAVNKINILAKVVHSFKEQNKKILLLGRKHMLKWPKRPLQYLMSNTYYFFTENLTQDDPYFITAAIMSGKDTDLVSKDLLRGHKFLMKDEQLSRLFMRWQWQHQWKLYNKTTGPVLQSPLSFTPCAQKVNKMWHIPYEKEDLDLSGKLHDGIPESTSWLCLQPSDT